MAQRHNQKTKDNIFALFHSILYRINDTKPKEERIVILDKDIARAIERFCNDNSTTTIKGFD